MYYDRSSAPCPSCGGETNQDSVDVGVGVIHGPRGCIECGWSEADEYDMTNPANRKPENRQRDANGGYKDQYGGYHPRGSSMALAYDLAAEKPQTT